VDALWEEIGDQMGPDFHKLQRRLFAVQGGLENVGVRTETESPLSGTVMVLQDLQQHSGTPQVIPASPVSAAGRCCEDVKSISMLPR
jgi:hypothetical protein